ncbi:MAG: ammonium transporter [Alphaproteobacteria bacterium]|nr:ammonium transporter [Alphaproteobacteria bacterium]
MTIPMIDTFMLLLCGVFVLLAGAGMTMLKTGLTRAHTSATLCLMDIGTCCIAVLTFYLLGNYLMGAKAMDATAAPQALWFFNAALSVFAALIVSGAVAERIRIWPYFLFIAFFSGILWPLLAGWSWGGGWLGGIGSGFKDLGGSAVIHVAAGCAALAGSYILGPRAGRYGPDGHAVPFPGSNIPLAAIGFFVLWAGWLALCGGRGLLETASAEAMGLLFTNILLAGAAGGMAALAHVVLHHAKPDITIIINGALAGLVSVAGGADLYTPFLAILIAAIGSVICCHLIPLLDKRKIDDPVGTIPVHLAGGIWGTLAVALFATGDFVAQVVGLVAIGGVALAGSAAVWLVIKNTLTLRCSERAERHGVDMDEVGVEAYPDFSPRTAGRPDITQIERF